jgi:hypothetical protein
MGYPYHQSFGVYADGIALSEVALPDGWEGRVGFDADPTAPSSRLSPTRATST